MKVEAREADGGGGDGGGGEGGGEGGGGTFLVMSMCGLMERRTVGLWWMGRPAMKMSSACGMHSAGSDVISATLVRSSVCGTG